MKHTTTLVAALCGLLFTACEKEEAEPPVVLDPGPGQYTYEVQANPVDGQYITIYVNGVKRDSLSGDGAIYFSQGFANVGDTLRVRTRLSAPDPTPEADTAFVRVRLYRNGSVRHVAFINTLDATWQVQEWVAAQEPWQ